MNHDYAHCMDYTGDCPQECFRAQLVRDLRKNPTMNWISWSSFKDTEQCKLPRKEWDI